MRHILTPFVCIILTASSMIAQVQPTLQSSVQTLVAEAARGYLQPVASGFTTNMHGAWFHEAPPARKFGFLLDIGVVGMAANVPLDQTFSRSASYQFTPDQARQSLSTVSQYNALPANVQNDILRAVTARNFTVQISGPTAIGSKNDNVKINLTASDLERTFTTTMNGRPVSVTIPNNQSFGLDVRGLLDPRDYFLTAVPFAAPQLTIGTFMGTRGVVRFVPNIADWVGLGKLGNISMFGWGIQHNPLTWFFADSTALPLSIGLNFYNQSYRLTDAVRAAGNAYGISASWTLGGAVLSFTPYAGFLLENSTITVDYRYQPRSATGQIVNDVNGQPLQPVPIFFEMQGENTSRIVLGASLRLLYLLDVGAEINIGNRYTTLNANVSVRIGNDLPK